MLGQKDKPIGQGAMLKPSLLVGRMLVARYTSMTPEQQQAIKGIITPQTTDSIKVLLPELIGLLRKKTRMKNG